jgi:rhamnogalacturonyl hydrolase YesR
MLREACDAAARVQDPRTGEFHHILDIPQTPYGRIYTPALAYVFLRGARLGYLPGEFVERGQMAWSAVKRHVFQGGSFGADGGAPQSKRLEFYLMQPMTYDFRAVRSRCFWQLHAANEIMRLPGNT